MPFSFDPINFDPLKPRGAARPRDDYRRPATPEATEGFAQSVKNLGLTGLGYSLSVLDKPRRALAGVIAGKPREALAALPFSDTLGITDPAQSTSGAELNKKYLGIKDDNSWKSWGAGLANELALDPLNLVSFGTKGALTAAGRSAHAAGLTKGMSRAQLARGFDLSHDALVAAGHTPDEIAHLARQQTVAPAGSGINAGDPLTGLARVSVPFTGKGVTLGAGAPARAVAPVMDTIGDFAKYKIPGVKTMASLFDNSVGRSLSEEGQRGFRAYGTPVKAAEESVGRGQQFRTIDAVHSLTEKGYSPEQVQDALRMHAEGVNPSDVLQVHPELWQHVQQIHEIPQISPEHLATRQQAGVPQSRLADAYIKQFPRKGVALNRANSTQMKGGGLYPTIGGSMIKRKNIYRDTPGGTAMWNQWATSPELAGSARTLSHSDATAKVLDHMTRQAMADGIAMTPQMTADLAVKAEKISKRLAKHEPASGPIFARDIAADVSRAAASQARMLSSAKGAVGTIGDIATRRSRGMVPIGRLLGGRNGLKLKTFADEQGIRGGLVELHKAMARHGAEPTEQVVDAINQRLQAALQAAPNAPDPALARSMATSMAQKALKRKVNRFAITPQQAENLLRDHGRWGAAPAEVSQPLKALDSFTQMFRNAAYSVWLPSHVRNLMGGLVQTAGQGGLSPQSQALAYGIRNGTAKAADLAKFLPGMPQGLSDEAARKYAIEMGYTHAKIGSGINAHETLPGAPAAGQHALPGTEAPITPIEYGKAGLQTAGAIGKGLLNPKNWIDPRRWPQAFRPGGALEQAGVVGGEKNFPWLEANRRLGTDVENQMRMAQFLHHSQQGMALPVAGEKTLGTHFDYQDLSQFEKNVMRRAVPFYNFTRKNLPLQLRTLASNPGRISSQLRVTAPKGHDYIPEHLASGVAIPVGDEYQNKEGHTSRQYVSQLGIPVEEALERLKVHPGDLPGSIRDTAMAYMGGLNPVIKGPLEYLFNKQFFSGRNLTDLKPQGTIGGLAGMIDPEQRHPAVRQLITQALANSPATRFLTAADKLVDPRKSLAQKALNLLTGVRVTDVDTEKTKAIETRKVLESILSHYPQIAQHTETYVKPEDKGHLTPDLVEKLQILARLQSNAQVAAKQKRMAQMQAQQPVR